MISRLLFEKRPNWILPFYRFLYPLFIIKELLQERDSFFYRAESELCYPIEIFSTLSLPVLNDSNIHFYFNFLLISLLFLSLGILTNISALLSSGLFFWIVGSTISCSAIGRPPVYIPWNHAIVFFNLIVLFVSPSGTGFSIDRFIFRKKNIELKNWPIFLLKFNLVYSYFAGGIAKLQYGLDWMNGYSLQTQLIYRHIDLYTPYALPIIHSHLLAVVISIIVVITEVLFPLSLFNKKIAFVCISGSLVFQALFAFIIKLKWMHFFGWSYFIYFLEAMAFIIAAKKLKKT